MYYEMNKVDVSYNKGPVTCHLVCVPAECPTVYHDSFGLDFLSSFIHTFSKLYFL